MDDEKHAIVLRLKSLEKRRLVACVIGCLGLSLIAPVVVWLCSMVLSRSSLPGVNGGQMAMANLIEYFPIGLIGLTLAVSGWGVFFVTWDKVADLREMIEKPNVKKMSFPDHDS